MEVFILGHRQPLIWTIPQPKFLVYGPLIFGFKTYPPFPGIKTLQSALQEVLIGNPLTNR